MSRKLAVTICSLVVGIWAVTSGPVALADGDPTEPYEGTVAPASDPISSPIEEPEIVTNALSTVIESALLVLTHTRSVLWVGR